MNLEARWGF